MCGVDVLGGFEGEVMWVAGFSAQGLGYATGDA